MQADALQRVSASGSTTSFRRHTVRRFLLLTYYQTARFFNTSRSRAVFQASLLAENFSSGKPKFALTALASPQYVMVDISSTRGPLPRASQLYKSTPNSPRALKTYRNHRVLISPQRVFFVELVEHALPFSSSRAAASLNLPYRRDLRLISL